MGDVIGDLNSRRGMVNKFEDKPAKMKLVSVSVVKLCCFFSKPEIMCLDWRLCPFVSECQVSRSTPTSSRGCLVLNAYGSVALMLSNKVFATRS